MDDYHTLAVTLLVFSVMVILIIAALVISDERKLQKHDEEIEQWLANGEKHE